MSILEKNRAFSEFQLSKLRQILKTDDSSFAIVVGGSISRREASAESDIDYYIFGDDRESIGRGQKLWKSKLNEISQVVKKAPSNDGAFGIEANETVTELVKNIGGNDDLNGKLTRRILFLLESTWLTSESTVEKYRREVLLRYITDKIENQHLCRFLLSDIIRYYRTICVDFEFKTFESRKPWGLRYIKLRFSRQLLYFSGLIAIAETVDKPRDEKINTLLELFRLSPLDRVKHVCKQSASEALDLYAEFLEKISAESTRSMLNATTADKTTHTKEFIELRDKGRQFSEALIQLLRVKYPGDHKIHNAIMF